MDKKDSKVEIPIVDFDELIFTWKPGDKRKSKHGELFPNNVRGLIIGRSGSGKTNLLLNLIFNRHGLSFKHLYLFSKSLNQDKYRFVEKVFSTLKCVKFTKTDNTIKIPHPNALQKDSLVIFDDLETNNVPSIKHYFTMGRHNRIDCFYLIQSYGAIQKHLIRDNANLVLIFKIDDLNLKLIHRDFSSNDMNFKTFKKLCSDVWKKGNHSFVSIFTESELNRGKYREQLDNFISNNF